MMGHRMMAMVDKRLRQATGMLHTPLGGMSVILIGDFAQLPPVGDKPLYCEEPRGALAIHGYNNTNLQTVLFCYQSGTGTSTNRIRFNVQ